MISLDEEMQSTEQYLSTVEFVRICKRFKLLSSTEMFIMVNELYRTYDLELGLCDECQRTNDSCNCSRRYDDYDDDDYDRYNDR